MTENNSINKEAEDFIINKAAGDPFITYQIAGSDKFSIGVDDTDSDKLKITTGATPSAGTECLTMTSAGAADFPVSVNSEKYSISGTQLITRDTVPISGDGTYYLAKGDYIIGRYIISWSGTNRVQTAMIDVVAIISENHNVINVVSNRSFIAQEVLSNFCFYTDGAGSSKYLGVTVGNRNGGTADIAVTYIGHFDIELNPTAPTTPTYKITYGLVDSSTTYGYSYYLDRNANTIAQTMSSIGAQTMPLQPSFYAYNSVNAADVTGDNTAYTVICDTEIFDQNDDYNNTTGVFTAPVTGKYLFQTEIRLEDLNADTYTNAYGYFVTSNRSYQLDFINPNNVHVAGRYQISCSVVAEMDVADTCYVTAIVSGGTKSVDVEVGTTGETRFCGALLC